MRNPLLTFIALGAALLSGCSIKQTVTPASISSTIAPQICLIPAEGLRPGFHTTYEKLLKEKGFQTRVLAPGSSPDTCPFSTTYIGRWSWDFTIYMSYADIRVFQNGRQVGQAEYDARGASMTFTKFVNAEAKIAELTNQLFPTGPAGEAQLRGVAGAPAGPLGQGDSR